MLRVRLAQQGGAGAAPTSRTASSRATALAMSSSVAKKVLHLPIVDLRPASRAVARLDESDLQAKAEPIFCKLPSRNVGHAQAVGDTPHVDRTTLEREGGGAGITRNRPSLPSIAMSSSVMPSANAASLASVP